MRISAYTEDHAPDVLKRLAEGESLRSICRAEGWPESTVRKRFRDDPALAPQYARAREDQADHYADKIVDGAHDATDAALGRLRMDALKWAASKLAPKRYGEKVALVGGGPEDNPLLGDVDLAARIASLISMAQARMLLEAPKVDEGR